MVTNKHGRWWEELTDYHPATADELAEQSATWRRAEDDDTPGPTVKGGDVQQWAKDQARKPAPE